MSQHHARRILTPGESRKRKERERGAFYPPKPPLATTSSKLAEPLSSNTLLAGYMAYEFLTKGTLMGQKFDPARAVAVPLRMKPNRAEPTGKMKPPPPPPTQQTYGEVANLMKSDGVHIPGVVNPSQLARWIQM